ncbi:MAG: hypothetical protein GY750_17315 [Lentisphaerae bacterium]|nr:hypothetical protein [Lentisphaerota bacterium]MCP4103158.1 hypothetical protein [Lentisphaerota bacterium]
MRKLKPFTIIILILIFVSALLVLLFFSGENRVIAKIRGKKILVGDGAYYEPWNKSAYELISPEHISVAQTVVHNSDKYYASYDGKVEGKVGVIIKSCPKKSTLYRMECRPVWNLMARRNIFGVTTKYVELDCFMFSYRAIPEKETPQAGNK